MPEINSNSTLSSELSGYLAKEFVDFKMKTSYELMSVPIENRIMEFFQKNPKN